MPTLAQWIEDLADGEPVEAAVLGRDERPTPAEGQPIGTALTWQEARPHLQYEFHDGLELGGCNAITAWTRNWVISVASSGGYVVPFRLPRAPIAHVPTLIGR